MAISQNTRPSCVPISDWLRSTVDEVEELDRLTELNSSLTGSSRSKIFELISAEEWSLLRHKRDGNISQVLATLPRCSLTPTKDDFIAEMAQHTNDFVIAYLERHLTELPQSREQFSKDLKTIAPNPPIVKTLRGNCGPTFLVGYPRWRYNTPSDPTKKTENGIACILKWTDPIEIASHRLYEVFATGFTGIRGSYPEEFFCVPKMTAFDQRLNRVDECTGLQPIEEKTAVQFKKLFESLIENYHQQPKITPSSRPIIMRQEKVKGQNLADFIRNRYASLTLNEKQSFFRRIGRIAYLDFVLGHNDRFVPVNTMTCSFGNNEANLGNLMVCDAPNGFGLFAIDNGINAHLCKPENQSAYLELLTRVLVSVEFDKILANQIKIAIQESLIEEEGHEIFSQDLDTIGLTQIQKGLKQMDVHMTQSLSKSWDSPSNAMLKAHLEDLEPGMPRMIDERIQAACVSAFQRPPEEKALLNPQSNPHLTPPNSALHLQKEPSQVGTPVINLLWTISQHCRGSLEDEKFFTEANVPLVDENTFIQTVYTLFHKIRNEGMNKEDLINLKCMIEQVLVNDCGVEVTHDSPLPNRSAPTPGDTPNHRASFRLSPSLALSDLTELSSLRTLDSPYQNPSTRKDLVAPTPITRNGLGEGL